MNVVVIAFALCITVFLETVLPAWKWLAYAKLPLVSGLVVYYALGRSWGLMLAVAIVGGLVLDGMVGLPLGASSLAYGIMGSGVWRFRGILFGGRWPTRMILGAVVNAGITLILYGVLCSFSDSVAGLSGARVSLKVLGTGVLGMLALPVLLPFVERLDRLAGNRTGEEESGL
ncbi:MAG: hypothetical protein HY343_03790 [Lentisphaerae bacterium]|nr:hypothetical protein [Lentisphaerota bacterium]